MGPRKAGWRSTSSFPTNRCWESTNYGGPSSIHAGIMPPADKPQPSDEERQLLDDWIKPTRSGSTRRPRSRPRQLRRLNRVEYRNTIRDLIGVDFRRHRRVPARRHRLRLRQHRRRPDRLPAAARKVHAGGRVHRGGRSADRIEDHAREDYRGPESTTGLMGRATRSD